jgi:hypothetical protein
VESHYEGANDSEPGWGEFIAFRKGEIRKISIPRGI